MGWGLRALEDVPRGALVIEYVGEVISEAQMKVRDTSPLC
jgi:SET domain-containing protein